MAAPTPTAPPSLQQTPTQWGITITVIVLVVLTNAVILLRLLVRKFVVKSLSWDDLTMFLAAMGNNVGTAMVLVEVHYGYGRHRSEIAPEAYEEYLRYSYIEWVQTFQTLMLTKISICLLLLRIVISRSFVYTLWTWIGMLLVSNFVLTFLWIAQCRPAWLAWMAPEEPGSCFSQTQLQQIIFSQAIVSAVSDFILAAYPIFIIRRLKMARRRKVGLCVLMGLGVFIGGLCIARTVLNGQNINQDSSWNVIPNWYIRSFEVCLGMTAACIPALHPGYRALRARWRGVPLSPAESVAPEDIEKALAATATMRTSGQSNAPRHSSSAPLVEKNRSVAEALTFPAQALRPDLRSTRATEVSHDDNFWLPIEDPRSPGITMTTDFERESERVPSTDDSVVALPSVR